MDALGESKTFVAYSLGKAGAVEDYPFGPDVIVIKVCGRMFALFSRRGGTANLALKCDPGYAALLRREHPAIIPGYHLDKRHWNTLILDGRLAAALVKSLIDHSYDLVVGKLTRAEREKLRWLAVKQ